MEKEYSKMRKRLARAIENCLTNGLEAEDIGGMIAQNAELPQDLLQECFLVAKVGDCYKCFPVNGIQAKTLAEINMNRMHSGEGSRIELDELDLSQLCAGPLHAQKL